MKNSKIVALVATAALLVLGAAFTSFAAQYNWYQQDGEWRCKNAAGDDYYAAWAKSGSDYYWLDDEGWMAREALVDDDNKYVNADGKMVKNDWVKLSDDEGNEYWNYFQAGGKKMLGKEEGPKPVTVNGKKYIFNTDGKMLSGWVQEGYDDATDDDYAWQTGVYYCGGEDDGAVTYGWKQIECYNEAEDFVDNNYWFWFGTNGIKFKAVDDGSGNAILKEKTINGKKYVFDQYGVMKAEWEPIVCTASVASTDAGSYAWFQSAEIGAKFANGWFRVVPTDKFDAANNEDDTAKWFYAKSGKLYQSVIKTINGKKYGFNDKGEMVTGLNAVVTNWVVDDDDRESIAGVTFTAIEDADGIAEYVDCDEIGWPDWYGVYYFSNDEDNDGSMKTGAQTIDVDGDAYSFYFSTKSGSKGLGLTGKQGNKYYYNGKKVAISDEKADYAFYHLNTYGGGTKFVNPNDWFLFRDAYYSDFEGKIPADEFVLINKSGAVSTSGTKKDGNGYKATLKKIDGEKFWVITEE